MFLVQQMKTMNLEDLDPYVFKSEIMEVLYLATLQDIHYLSFEIDQLVSNISL